MPQHWRSDTPAPKWIQRAVCRGPPRHHERGYRAGIDACLHLVRTECGASAANVVARRMVVPPQRAGGQSQYILEAVPVGSGESFAGFTEWMLEHLHEDLTVDQLAAWLNRQRLLRAQHLLEQSEAGLDQIAAESGFGTAAVMRHHFAKVLKTTPAEYRRTFCY